MANILLFSEVVAGEDRRAGIKGAGIALMHQKGFNTPPGFIITPDAFFQFMSSSGMLDEINDAIGSPDASIPDISPGLQRAVLRAALPERLRDEIFEAYGCISVDSGRRDASSLLSETEAPVAVRSSHLREEDRVALPNATILNVEGRDALIAAVKSCYASLLSPDALSAMRSSGQQLPGIAIIAQRMIDRGKCGTSKSLNPATEDRSEIVIRASDARGANNAPGEMPQEEYIIDKGTLSVKEASPAGKGILGDDEIMQIASLTAKIEKAVDRDFMIDWVISGKAAYILQYRQIRAASPRTDRISSPVTADSDDSEEAADDIAALPEIEKNQSLESGKDSGIPQEAFDISMREIIDMDQDEARAIPVAVGKTAEKPDAPDDLLSKVYHDAGNLLVTCDTSINARLRSYYQGSFQAEPPGFEETVLKISLRRPIPYLDDIILIHKLKERFLTELREPTVEEIFLALEVTEKFIKEF